MGSKKSPAELTRNSAGHRHILFAIVKRAISSRGGLQQSGVTLHLAFDFDLALLFCGGITLIVIIIISLLLLGVYSIIFRLLCRVPLHEAAAFSEEAIKAMIQT